MERRFLVALLLLPLVGMASLMASCQGDSTDNAVHKLTWDGDINPVAARYIDRGIDRAENNNAKLVVLELDTPGGLDSSMRDIVRRIETSKVPVAVYVAPVGGRAASAGTFITMSANIAAMAPNTSIGAASAINADGSDIGGTLGKKIENDAVAYIRGIAELRGRNADWAEQAVRDAVAVNQTEAVQLDVVDFTADNFQDLLRQSEGRTVSLPEGQTVTLQGLSDAPLVETDPTVWESFLDFLANPTVATLLISLGFIAILIELSNPGLIVPGTLGVVAIILGFVGFDLLPVDTAGILLILLGLVFIGLELFVPGGILGVSGVVAIVLGAIIAFRDTPNNLRPDWWLVALLATFVGALFVALTVGVTRTRRMSAATGTAALVGKVATARTPLAPDGYVFIQGERWQAHLDRGSAREGDKVRIVGAEGFQLRVKKEEPGDPKPAASV